MTGSDIKSALLVLGQDRYRALISLWRWGNGGLDKIHPRNLSRLNMQINENNAGEVGYQREIKSGEAPLGR